MTGFKMTKAALAASTALALVGCSGGSSDSGGGGAKPPVQVASDSCLALEANQIIGANSTYSGSVADLVDSTTAGQFQYSVATQPENGNVVIDAATGDYTFTPNSNTAGSRGYKVSFTFGVLDNGEQVDSATVELVYGPKRIMPLGDSITYGVVHYDGSQNNPDQSLAIGYRKELLTKLVSDGYMVDFVGTQQAGTDPSTGLTDTDHEGHPGDRADQLAANVNAYLNSTKPDLVLSHAGTNDLFQGRTEAEAATNVNTLVANMRTWRNNANNQALSVLVAKIIPSYESGGNTAIPNNAKIDEFNTQMAANIVANFNGIPNFKATVVDHNTPINPATDMTVKGTAGGQDRVGLHPNTSGYTKIANTWYDALIASDDLVKCD